MTAIVKKQHKSFCKGALVFLISFVCAFFPLRARFGISTLQDRQNQTLKQTLQEAKMPTHNPLTLAEQMLIIFVRKYSTIQH